MIKIENSFKKIMHAIVISFTLHTEITFIRQFSMNDFEYFTRSRVIPNENYTSQYYRAIFPKEYF